VFILVIKLFVLILFKKTIAMVFICRAIRTSRAAKECWSVSSKRDRTAAAVAERWRQW